MRTFLGGVLGKVPRPSPAMVVALLALLVACSGAAFAAGSFTASDGTITACRDNKTGVLRVINAPGGQVCNSTKETTITWKDGINGTVADSKKLAGQDASAYLGANQKAADSDKLDNKDSSDFAPNAAEPWHEVGQTGEPPFQNGWQDLGDGRTAPAAFFKDPWGIVHLRGTVQSGSTGGPIFTLPCGYGPDKDQNFAVVSYGANASNVGIVDVVFLTPRCADGTYRAQVNATQSSATALSLNDVSFRAYGP
jgi:hypothetical protein